MIYWLTLCFSVLLYACAAPQQTPDHFETVVLHNKGVVCGAPMVGFKGTNAVGMMLNPNTFLYMNGLDKLPKTNAPVGGWSNAIRSNLISNSSTNK